MSVGAIVDRLRAMPVGHVVLTGGEPLIMPEAVELCDAIKAMGFHLTLETSATVYRPVRLDLASMSPKLANSTPSRQQYAHLAEAHDRRRLNLSAIQQFIDCSPEFQLKFVVVCESDIAEIETVLSRLTGWRKSDVLLMPEGVDAQTLRARAAWVAEVCMRKGWRYCPRLHIELWGNRRGK